MNIQEQDKEYIAGTYNRFPIVIVSGHGSIVTDIDGKDYIDMTSGIAVNSFGVSDEIWRSAVYEQLCKVQHMSNLYYTEPCVKVAKILCERTGMKRVFFSNSGAEANECAIKVARKYAADTKGPDYYTIITLRNSFHGRTLTTLSATGQVHYHELFRPLTPGFVHAEADNFSEIESYAKIHKTAAIMIECVQGEGGVIALNPDYVKKVADFAKDNDIILIVDEVQTGNGRSGMLYSYMNYDIQPDVVSTAKGLAGGLPFGATLMGDKVKDTLKPGDHGSTFGGNPVAAAGAVSILERIDEKLLSGVRVKSKFLFDAFANSQGIEQVSGMGLMIGLKTSKPAKDVVNECMKNGVLCLTAKDRVRLLPALNIPDDLLARAADVIKTCCK
ncbi:MAG: aminotransferase class III-fold pyridoxal phosphate-dependent enzyme [Synergistaceae bacterium]|nr:aminotransferase class III-fold pyridoxal phosphate-dependent enzyme [Synergistaceae bacterium]